MNPKFLKRVRRNDAIARWIIHLFGIGVIAMVILILVIIAGVALPLFLPSGEKSLATMSAQGSGETVAIGVDEYLESGYQLTDSGDFLFFKTGAKQNEDGRWILDEAQSGTAIDTLRAAGTDGKSLKAWARAGQDRFNLTWDDGSSMLVNVAFSPSFDASNQVRTITHKLQLLAQKPATTNAVRSVLFAKSKNERDQDVVSSVTLTTDGRALIEHATAGMRFGMPVNKTVSGVLSDLPELDQVALSSDGGTLVGSKGAMLYRWSLRDPENAVLQDTLEHAGGDITSLGFVLGNISIAVGDAAGGLATYMPVIKQLTDAEEQAIRDSGDRVQRVLTLIHTLRGHGAEVTSILPASRNKAIVSLSEEGVLHLDYMTSERALNTIDGVAAVALSPRNNGLLVHNLDGGLELYKLNIPHPEVSTRALFGKIHYENYAAPVLEWQASAGHQSHEPKFSLMPLIFGTLKATFWAMLFAAPLAIIGALYSSQFMSPRWRNVVKPSVEIMAAVPSVVVGFLAAFWFGPILVKYMPTFFASLLVVPAILAGAILLMKQFGSKGPTYIGMIAAGLLLPFALFGLGGTPRIAAVLGLVIFSLLLLHFEKKGTIRGGEFISLFSILIFGLVLSQLAGLGIERWVMDTNYYPKGSFQTWLFESFGTEMKTSNAFLIMFALGFAVMPIIFTLADDALSTVPRGLTAASLALGASRWQTAWKVVLPSASPGIFAATMIGFGRAIGETMIVLMAAGGSPEMKFNPFEGMLTLSANIATEMPEVAVGSTHYRILFFSAVLLFAMTFAVNTLAEIIRIRLRQKYGNY